MKSRHFPFQQPLLHLQLLLRSLWKRDGLCASGTLTNFPLFCLPSALLLPLLGQVTDASLGIRSLRALWIWCLDCTFVPSLTFPRMVSWTFLTSCRPAPCPDFISFPALIDLGGELMATNSGLCLENCVNKRGYDLRMEFLFHFAHCVP